MAFCEASELVSKWKDHRRLKQRSIVKSVIQSDDSSRLLLSLQQVLIGSLHLKQEKNTKEKEEEKLGRSRKGEAEE